MTFFPDPQYDYGRHGRIGIATPQANPTVEAEFSILYPRSVSVQVARLVCADPAPEVRLKSYITDLEQTLEGYGGMPLTGFGFACTGSSYLIGAEKERDIEERLSKAFGYPVITAASAIKEALGALAARRIALVSPYPEWLSEAAQNYWADAGYEISSVLGIQTRTSNTQTIYELSSADAGPLLGAVDPEDVDVILMSGTGMPTLAAIEGASSKIPVVSSNLCLAWQLLRAAGQETLLDAAQPPFIRGWKTRLSQNYS